MRCFQVNFSTSLSMRVLVMWQYLSNTVSLVQYLLATCPQTSYESVQQRSFLALTSLNSFRLAMSALYFTWLFEALKLSLRACSRVTLSGPSRMILDTLPFMLHALSTQRLRRSGVVWSFPANSARKSSMNYVFMGLRGSYWRLNSKSSTNNATILPASSGFCKTCLMG